MLANKLWIGLALAAAPGALLAGCMSDDGNATDDGADSADSGSAEHALTGTQDKGAGTWFWSWGRDTNLPTATNTITINPTSQASCFLSGIGGDLISVEGAEEPSGTLYTYGDAGVAIDGGNYTLTAFAGEPGVTLEAQAMCTSDTAGRSAQYTYFSAYDSSATRMVADDGHHACFLQELYDNEEYYDSGTFASSTDEISIFSTGGYFYLGGTGDVAASAQCIEINSFRGEWNWTNGTLNLATNDENPGTQCFLTGFLGSLRDSDNYTDGAFINYNSGLLQYSLTVSSGKRAWAECID